MKKILFILCTLLLTVGVSSQSLYSSRLLFYGAALSVSPVEDMWVVGRSGYLLHTESMDSLWRLSTLENKVNNPLGDMSGFERVTLFNSDTLMISGNIRGDNSEDNFVWWSGDKGKNWEKIKFGCNSSIDAFFHISSGKAWMSGSSQYIYYTEDFGRTWKQFNKVEEKGNLRFISLCFDREGKVGLFGSIWNVLYKTSDNCRTWEKLPTPYTQKKYKWKYGSGGNSENRPEISKVRMIGSYYVIKQDGRVFVTNATKIDWIPLTSVLDFEVADNENIYLIHKDHTIELCDCHLATLWKSAILLPSELTSFTVQKETLFFTTSYSVGKIGPEGFYVRDCFTDEFPIPEPNEQITFENEKYGFENEDILLYDKSRKQWKRFLTTDFLIGNISNYKGGMLISDIDLTKHFTLDIERKELEPFVLPERIFEINIPIRRFSIEIGSRGCFHNDVARRVYERKKDMLVSDPKKDTTGDLNRMAIQLDISMIENLIKAIDSLKCHRLSLTDLEITEKDILDFQNFVEKESLVTENKVLDFTDEEVPLYIFNRNTDYNYYKNITPLLDKVNDSIMNLILNPVSRKWSTTTNWRKIMILLDNHLTLEIENDDYQPNYFYSPWVISYNGLKFKISSFEIGKMINTLTSNHYLQKKFKEKRYPLFQIADYFYHKEILNR